MSIVHCDIAGSIALLHVSATISKSPDIWPTNDVAIGPSLFVHALFVIVNVCAAVGSPIVAEPNDSASGWG